LVPVPLPSTQQQQQAAAAAEPKSAISQISTQSIYLLIRLQINLLTTMSDDTERRNDQGHNDGALGGPSPPDWCLCPVLLHPMSDPVLVDTAKCVCVVDQVTAGPMTSSYI